MTGKTGPVLTINSGSSSIKFSIYSAPDVLSCSGLLDRIGLAQGTFKIWGPEKEPVYEETIELEGHGSALQRLFSWLKEAPGRKPAAIGHRVVHGGRRYRNPVLIDLPITEELVNLISFAPEHLPHEVLAIEACMGHFPDLNQVACFDTSFHRAMPEAAQVFSLPYGLYEGGVLRYGFHGLSYEYIMGELSRTAGGVSGKKVIIAHLGNGCSMAAVKDGKPVDTTMGFTPAGGLVMGRRTGDLDPGLIVYLLKEKGLTPDELNSLINTRSGLLGISGVSSDMRDVIAESKDSRRAALAFEIFCYQAKKFIGAFSAAMGGLDVLVFTAGIGENSPKVRSRICEGLEFLGVALEGSRNEANSGVISADGSKVEVRVIKTNEELMIARHTFRLAF